MERNLTEQQTFSWLRIPAKFLSYAFHPLFIPTYVFLWLIVRFPYEFNYPANVLKLRVFSVFWMTAFFPAFAVFLLWRLKFINNIYLRTQKDRIVPYIITMFFYWWMWYLSKNFSKEQLQPEILRVFFFGSFLTTIAGLVLNNFFKISMHAMGIAGGWLLIILSCFTYSIHLGEDITVVTLLAGLVCSARLILSEHTTFEVYAGFVVGVICELIAWWV
ncbi:hypothetical protein QTN47_21960 [Danxiaibacter flavus]|uniref:Phosphatase PAP2 family protein n=1 Tax=Danxiaibacter flavus TaxID=3049108 RepID=A0ABV3ZJX9_9BACT|nr:hypothetical protein QNM32_21965 [Chitinophagaceae bacterium DXS]